MSKLRSSRFCLRIECGRESAEREAGRERCAGEESESQLFAIRASDLNAAETAMADGKETLCHSAFIRLGLL